MFINVFHIADLKKKKQEGSKRSSLFHKKNEDLYGEDMKGKKIGLLVFLLFLCIGGGYFAGSGVDPSSDAWYQSLDKYAVPPGPVFGIVWFILYTFMGIAVWLIWTQRKSARRTKALVFFFLQLICNFAYMHLFFGLENPLFGLLDIGATGIFTLITMYFAYTLSKAAFWLLVPYILWLGFAFFLNFMILVLN